MGGLTLLQFPIRPSSLALVPFLSDPKSHLSYPREEGSEVLSFESSSDSGFISQNLAFFYSPNKTFDWSILTSRDFG